MIEGSSTIQPSYRNLRSLYLGAEFIRKANMAPGRRYVIVVDGYDDLTMEGTLDKSSLIGGVAPLYNTFDLKDGDIIRFAWDDAVIHLYPAGKVYVKPADTVEAVPAVELVFDRQKLQHVHVESFAPGNLSRWNPQTEPDVYMSLGVLAEYTDYRYCCGASKALLDKLGYTAATKPDAILIDRTTSAYLMAEFKMRSSEFKGNHSASDVDVLVCWIDDETDKVKLPPRVLSLKSLLERIVKDGDVDL
jgi:hypothetical protein